MGYICDFCGEQRSMVYCRSDAACLCLSCDRNVHSANALSKRHSRTLICERCNLQPALVRCSEERVSLCQNCDWIGHGASTSASAHKRQTINCYSGCPSASELSSIWSFVLDVASTNETTCEQELGLMSITENGTRTSCDSADRTITENTGVVEINDEHNMGKSGDLVGSSSMHESNSAQSGSYQLGGLANKTYEKLCYPGRKGPQLCEDDLFNDFNMEEMDLDLENYDELFGLTLNPSEELLENGGIKSLFGAKGMSASEGQNVALTHALHPTCSAASADSMMSTKTEPIPCFTERQSNLSFSGATVETTAGDYQDCGASSAILMGEPPWCPPSSESSLQTVNRNNAVMRYKEKKKSRKFEKKVRYASRKPT